MNEIKIFDNPEFGKVRTMEINGEPYFVGKDVAIILGYAKPENAIANHITFEVSYEILNECKERIRIMGEQTTLTNQL